MKVFSLQLAVDSDRAHGTPVVMTATELPFEFSLTSFNGIEQSGTCWLSGGDRVDLEVLTANIEESGGVLRVSLTNLGGRVLAEERFSMNAMVLDLEGMVGTRKPAWRAMNFYSDHGSRAERTDRLLDHCR